MAAGIHATVLATALAATVAVGIASASMVMQNDAAPKADRLPVPDSAKSYATVETRRNGLSILQSFEVDFD